MSTIEIILLVLMCLCGFYIIKSIINFYQLMAAGELYFDIKRKIIFGYYHNDKFANTFDMEDFIKNFDVNDVIRNPYFVFLCPWIWLPKQCFKRRKFKRLISFYHMVNI